MTQPAASAPATETNLDRRLAEDAFRNSRVSVAMGFCCALIIISAQLGHISAGPLLLWSLTIASVFCARLVLAGIALQRLAKGEGHLPLINLEATLAALTGLTWSTALWVFDTGTQDHLFYFRIILVVGALAFVVSSLTLYLRVFMAYSLAVVVPCTAILFVLPHAQPKGALVGSFVLFAVVLLIVATINNRRTRSAVASQIEVVRLTGELADALASERRALAALSAAAVTDELTGALNRRGILAALDAEIARSQRFRHGLALLLIDIDHFKRINDNHGHACGDEALRRVVSTLRAMLRTTDAIGRLGGEEFLVLLPELDSEGARVTAERLRESVAATPIEFAGATLRPTISIGLAVHHAGESAERLVARADEALYAAKRNGRNRVERAPAGAITDGAPTIT